MHRAHIGSGWAHHIPLYSGWDLYTKVFRNNDAGISFHSSWCHPFIFSFASLGILLDVGHALF
jgi:hypothetical protein